MKKRKILGLIMALSMTAALVNGCGSSGSESSTQSADAGTMQGTEQDTAQEEADADPFGRYDELVEISSVKNLGAPFQTHPARRRHLCN